MKIYKEIHDYFFNNRRKKKVIDKISQFQMAAELLLHIVLFFFLTTLVLYVDPLATLFSDHSLNEHQEAIHWLFEINAGKWPLLVLAAIVLSVISIYFSHRISGPAYKIEMMLRRYATRDLSTPTYLRTHDYLTNIPPAVNELRETVIEDLQKANSIVASMLQEINLLPEGSQKQTLKALADQMAKQLQLYNLQSSQFAAK